MQRSHRLQGCGTIDSHDGSGSKEVVVAGDNGSDAESVEIFSSSEDTWHIGEEFNFP